MLASSSALAGHVTLPRRKVVDVLTTLKFQANAAGVRFAALNGEEHMVIPTVAVMEIVLNGVPVPVGHPVGASGYPVSAETPDQIEQVAGYFFNVSVDRADRHKLRGEIWLILPRVHAPGGDAERAYSQLHAGQSTEVSSAFFADFDDADCAQLQLKPGCSQPTHTRT